MAVNLINSTDIEVVQDGSDISLELVNSIPVVDSNVSTSSTNAIENQAITNYVDTSVSQAITDLTTITNGAGTPNSTYVSAVENNTWTRVGQVVCFSFTLTTNNNWDYTSTIFTGLPKAKNTMRFIGLWTNNNAPLRLSITDDGELKNAWSSSNPTSSQTVEGCVVYITKD